MFSFHKPKIYRSNLGCCICKAKSSSSRFTDSNKYENEFERCFRIQEKRSGEICNACVLLVKRWKKLSAESRLTKHWHHVVDARAGPGTKLTGNRRLTGSHNHSSSSSSSSSQSSSANSTTHNSSKNHQRLGIINNNNNNKSDVLPLSSNQAANNQSTNSSSSHGQQSLTGSKARSLSKARAIDTNVSTFTFGEPYYRRSYMSTEQQSYSSMSAGICKPQSALNSSAFESVIKRFRQRQQQEQLDSQRRQQSRQQRSLKQQQQQSKISSSDQTSTNKRVLQSNLSSQDQTTTPIISSSNNNIKRVKRSSECSLADVSSLLDGTIWRKEKICCGYIFRGLFNEVAVLPKLLKPCSCRIQPTTSQQQDQPSPSAIEDDVTTPQLVVAADLKRDDDKELLRMAESPPPRANKSGSISSCDSNTSGTGSMEPSMEEIQAIKRLASATSVGQRHQVAAKRPRSIPVSERQQNKPPRGRRAVVVAARDQDSSSSSSSGGKINSPTGSSSSLSQIMLITGEEEEEEEEIIDDDEDVEDDDEEVDEDEEEEEDDDDDEDELVLDDEECESGNDVSSNVDSLADIEQNKKPIAMG